jgi:hypothetical protein
MNNLAERAERGEDAGKLKLRRFGPKVDYHCPFEEATLRVSLFHPGMHICPVCWTEFAAPVEPVDPPPMLSDNWFMRLFRALARMENRNEG